MYHWDSIHDSRRQNNSLADLGSSLDLHMTCCLDSARILHYNKNDALDCKLRHCK